MLMFAGLFGILLITTAAAQSCSASQIASDAQITLYADSIIPETAVRGGAAPDPNLMFFSDVLGYNDDENSTRGSKCTSILLRQVWLRFLPH